MNNSNQDLWNKTFSHIYIEEALLTHERARQILCSFPDAVIVPIQHYKDVFNRSHQNFHIQSLQKKLILAVNPGQLVYPGAPVCQNFGQEYFYYTSNVLNCLYDCEYCYLQGMYPSSNLVVFLNLHDNFAELAAILKEHPAYVCISYDTDLLTLEPVFHFIKDWIAFAKCNPELTIEVRTKSANARLIEELEPIQNMIYAWTLSPEPVSRQYEHRAPSFRARLLTVLAAIKYGHPVRLCFDPMLVIPDAVNLYTTMIDEVFSQIDASMLYDVSLGLFRISKEYLKQFRSQRPDSAIAMYPYQLSDGYCHYSKESAKELLSEVYKKLKLYVPEESIFMDAIAKQYIE